MRLRRLRNYDRSACLSRPHVGIPLGRDFALSFELFGFLWASSGSLRGLFFGPAEHLIPLSTLRNRGTHPLLDRRFPTRSRSLPINLRADRLYHRRVDR